MSCSSAEAVARQGRRFRFASRHQPYSLAAAAESCGEGRKEACRKRRRYAASGPPRRFSWRYSYSCAPARAADAPVPARSSDWKYRNPFCGVIAHSRRSAPIGYGLALFAEKGTTLAAHVTLVSKTDAYDVSVPDSEPFGAR